MKTILITWLTMIGLAGSCAGETTPAFPPPVNLESPDFEAAVDAHVQAFLDLDIFSGVVLIAREGEPVYHKAYGLADRARGISNTIHTRFDIGSMNKSMTKVIVLQLVREGKLALDDTLGEFLDGFPKAAAEGITVEHLLNHRSGLGPYHRRGYWEIPAEDRTLDTVLHFIRTAPPEFAPGREQAYSNSGYVVLGLIAEAATGKSYYDLVEERILEPLDMQDTYLRNKTEVPGRAVGYFKDYRGEIMDNEGFSAIPTPAGGFYSTTTDMLTFYRAFHYGDRLWNEDTRALDEWNGFYREHRTTGGAMSHAGGFEGANTVHFEILRDDISVLVFANMDEPVAERLGSGILALIRGKQPAPPSLPADQAVYAAWKVHGADYVREHWDDLTVNFHPQDPKDLILNQIGYDLLFSGQGDEAVELFRLNTELFPGVANCWDSYGEGLLNRGENEAALNAYRKALSIDPEFPSALEMVEQLERE